MSTKSTAAAILVFLALPCAAQPAALPAAASAPTPAVSTFTDIPAKFTPDKSSFDFVLREAMIPMRDGIPC